MKMLKVVLISLILFLLAPHIYSYADEATIDVDMMAEKFFCTCGCNMLLSVCETQMTCEVAKSMKKEIEVMIDKGLTEEEIVESMKKRYGDQILAIPPKEGFTLSLWVYPVLGVIAGSFIIYMVSRRRKGAKWYLDPDEVPELDEEEISVLEEAGVSEEEVVSSKYEKLLKEKYKEFAKKKEED
jgi:cytochrome c-type biogenesis protein CcmH